MQKLDSILEKRTNPRIFNKIIYTWKAVNNILRSIFNKKLGLSSILENLISLEGENITNKKLSNDDNYFLD